MVGIQCFTGGQPGRRPGSRGGGPNRGRTGLAAAAAGVLSALGMLLIGGGCQATAWERTFEAHDGLVETGAAPAARSDAGAAVPFVDVRRVPWERMDGALERLNELAASSSTHPEEWTTDRLGRARAELLEALQISEPPARVEVLGRSLFTTTDPVRPDDGSLAAFARAIGADRAVWASRYLGKAERIEREPVTSYNSGSTWFKRDGRWRSGSYSENSTTYIPVVIDADEFAFAVYYLRVGRRAEAEPANR